MYFDTSWVLIRAALTSSNYWLATDRNSPGPTNVRRTSKQLLSRLATASITAHDLGSLSMINKTMSSTCSDEVVMGR